MVDCTSLENWQSRKALVGSNPTASAIAVVLTAWLAGCTSIPGESTAPRRVQQDVNDRVLALARAADPQCRQQRVTQTEMVNVHGDGATAEEVWTVTTCGQRLRYIVTFPPKRGPTGGSVTGFSVRPER